MKFFGKVERGQGFATIAFGLPTANLVFDESIALEAGVYAGYGFVGKQRYNAVIYIGPQGSERFETHLFDFTGDLYDQILEVEILKLIGNHVPWESEEQMKTKVAADVQKARDYFATPSSSV
jgi:riboflavin kinase/FMN adenylyltransferase